MKELNKYILSLYKKTSNTALCPYKQTHKNGIFFKTLLITTFLISGFATAQNVDFKRSNFKDNVDDFKAATDAISAGTTLFTEGSLAIFEVRDPGLTFKKALIQFEIAQKLNPDNALNNFR